MNHPNSPGRVFGLALGLAFIAAGATAQAAKTPAAKKNLAGKPAAAAPAPRLEPKAIDLLKAMSARLAAARSMSFTAVTTYESPSIYGAPLAFTTTSEVTVQRPNKLRMITAGDGPAVEFYYDGKTMSQFSPAENLLAVADAPPTIDGMLKALYDTAGTYLPFTDVIVADPWADMSPGLKIAFYIGQSNVVGGTKTDMVAYESEGVFVQIWIGADDKLPRLARAVYHDDPLQLRQQVELSHWQLDSPVAADAFGTTKAAGAIHIQFAHPKTQSKIPAPPAPVKKSGKLTPKSQPAPKP
jgi:hypothetical protein